MPNIMQPNANKYQMIHNRDNYTFLTEAPVGKVILTMGVPTVISMLVTSIYNIVDTWYVGMLNTQATAAVGVVFPIMSAIQAVGFFFGQGSGTFVSRKLGAKETGAASRMIATSFICALLFGLAISVCSLLFLEPLSVALGSSPTILPYTMQYLGIVALGAPFMTGSMVLNNQMRFQGNAKNAMYGMLTGAVLNIALVPLFMFTFELGILGCAIGTLISQIAGFLVLLQMSFRGGNLPIKIRDFSFKKRYYVEIFKGGTPSLSRQGLASLSTMLLNVAAGAYGDAAIAGMSIVTRVTFFVFAIIIGIGQGFQPLCGFCYGARLYKRVKEGFYFCLKAYMVILIPTCLLTFIFADSLIDMLRHDPHVVDVGAVALRWQVITFPIAAFLTASNMMLQTSGRTISANLLASARNGLYLIPAILILPHFLGLLGVEISQAVADIFSFAMAVPIVKHYFATIKS